MFFLVISYVLSYLLTLPHLVGGDSHIGDGGDPLKIKENFLHKNERFMEDFWLNYYIFLKKNTA